MGIALGSIDAVLIGVIIVVVLALAWDTFGRSLDPVLRRIRDRYLPQHVDWKAFLPFLGSIGLAVLMRLPLMSAYIIVAGLLITVYGVRRAEKEKARIPASQIFQLILSFRGEYLLQPGVFLTLDKARQRVEDPLNGLMGIAVQTYNATASPRRAFAELRARTDNVYLGQFTHILEMSEVAPPSAVVKALDNMVDRLRVHDVLHRETTASLTSITGQTRFMHGVAILSTFLVAVVPMLHTGYASTSGQIVFMILGTVILGASYYIDRTIDNLSERIS